ncbi:Nitric-oxide synthase [Toxoplasma gondii MAS]|uniref:Nitric-oxide synthase n=1 Tax=Toxoplasma gondii MAS TaxID=943118 RepID=A0A086QRG9_TOXGO|nr:Nitric-oxide synthase [Toxoplasma gondii MAS]
MIGSALEFVSSQLFILLLLLSGTSIVPTSLPQGSPHTLCAHPHHPVRPLPAKVREVSSIFFPVRFFPSLVFVSGIRQLTPFSTPRRRLFSPLPSSPADPIRDSAQHVPAPSPVHQAASVISFPLPDFSSLFPRSSTCVVRNASLDVASYCLEAASSRSSRRLSTCFSAARTHTWSKDRCQQHVRCLVGSGRAYVPRIKSQTPFLTGRKHNRFRNGQGPRSHLGFLHAPCRPIPAVRTLMMAPSQGEIFGEFDVLQRCKRAGVSQGRPLFACSTAPCSVSGTDSNPKDGNLLDTAKRTKNRFFDSCLLVCSSRGNDTVSASFPGALHTPASGANTLIPSPSQVFSCFSSCGLGSTLALLRSQRILRESRLSARPQGGSEGSSQSKKRRKNKGHEGQTLASSDVEDVWLREDASRRFLSSTRMVEERRREALQALAELEGEHDDDDPVVAKLKDQLLVQAQQCGGTTSNESRGQGEEGASREETRRTRGQTGKKGGDAWNTMDEIAKMEEEEERRDRLEHLRIHNPGALFTEPKGRQEGKPEVYVHSAEIRVKGNRCFGCGAAFQTRNPEKAAYIAPDLLVRATAPSTSSDSSVGVPEPYIHPLSLDLSTPESAAKAFASTGGDIEKVVDLAARADSVDFEAFVSALAAAGGADKQDVLDKLSLACDYNGEQMEDEARADDEKEPGKSDRHDTRDRGVAVERSEGDDAATGPEKNDIEEPLGDDSEMLSVNKEGNADDYGISKARCTGETMQGKSDTNRGVRVETMSLSQEELAELLGPEAADAFRDTSLPDKEQPRPGPSKPILCQRCHAMRSGKKIDEGLRVGFSHGDDLLHPDRFKRLVGSLRTKRCIFLLFLDLISPELIPALPDLVRVNPLYVAVTKCDLLPGSLRRPDAPFNSRAEGFRRRCITNTNVARHYVFEMLSRAYKLKDFTVKNIFMISNKSGAGLTHLINAVGKEAIRRKRPVYVIGAANAGKSSFLNKILAKATRDTDAAAGPLQKPQLKGAKAAAAAASAVPGTTLDFIPIVVNGKWKVIDTPGVFLKGSYANLLTQEELQAAVPSSALHLCSARVAEGQGVWLGGLARVELHSNRGCFFSFFLSRALLIRPFTAARTPEEKLESQRSRLFPPFSPARLKVLSPLVPQDFYVEGKGWEEAATDIVLSGLGWISITGCGSMRVRVYVPDEVRVYQRPALVPRATRACPAVATGLLKKVADRQVVHRQKLQASRPSPGHDLELWQQSITSEIFDPFRGHFEERGSSTDEFLD